jgi:hypothetical protein
VSPTSAARLLSRPQADSDATNCALPRKNYKSTALREAGRQLADKEAELAKALGELAERSLVAS